MKELRWYVEREPIPDGAKFIRERMVVTEWASDHDMLPEYPSKFYAAYLYEVPIDPNPQGIGDL